MSSIVEKIHMNTMADSRNRKLQFTPNKKFGSLTSKSDITNLVTTFRSFATLTTLHLDLPEGLAAQFRFAWLAPSSEKVCPNVVNLRIPMTYGWVLMQCPAVETLELDAHVLDHMAWSAVRIAPNNKKFKQHLDGFLKNMEKWSGEVEQITALALHVGPGRLDLAMVRCKWPSKNALVFLNCTDSLIQTS